MTILKMRGLGPSSQRSGNAKRIRDFYKIISRITDEYALEYVDTNHLILHDRGTGERVDLNGILNIFEWCVSYVTTSFGENNVPLSKLHYLPMALIRKASEVDLKKRPTKDDKTRLYDDGFEEMEENERMLIATNGVLSTATRVDGKVAYLDEYELRLNDYIDEVLANIIDGHLSKKISDEEFIKLVCIHEVAELFARGRHNGEQ